jgi:hypothetical protein
MEPPIRRRAKVSLRTIVDCLPCHGARVAAQGRSRVSNPEARAQNVLIKKWQITSAASPLDASALQDYNAIYRSPLGSTQHRAIHSLFAAKDLLPSVEPMDVEP